MNFLDGNLNVYSEPDTGENVQGASTVEGTTTSAEGYLNTQTSDGSGTESRPATKETTTTGTWRDQLPKDVRDSEGLTGFKSVGDLAKAYLAKGAEGKADSDFLGKASGADEEWDKFTGKMTEEADPSGGISNSIIKVAKEVGIKPSQAKAIMEELSGYENEIRQQSGASCEKAMRRIWGDSYDVNKVDALSGYEKIIGSDGAFAGAVKSSGLVNNPIVVEMCRRIGGLLKEPQSGFIGASPETRQSTEEDLYGTNLFKRK